MGWPPEAPQGPSSCRFTRKTCFCKEKCFTQAHFFHKKRDKIRFSEQKFVFWVPMWLLQNRSLQLVTVPQLYIVGCVALSGAHPPHCCPRWVLQVERLLAEEIRGLGVAAVPAVIKIDLNRQTSYSWQEEVGQSRSAFLQKFMITSCGAARLCKKKEKRKHKNPNPPFFGLHWIRNYCFNASSWQCTWPANRQNREGYQQHVDLRMEKGPNIRQILWAIKYPTLDHESAFGVSRLEQKAQVTKSTLLPFATF